MQLEEKMIFTKMMSFFKISPNYLLTAINVLQL